MKIFKTSIKVSYVVMLLLCISCNKEEKKLTQEITQLEKESDKLEKEIAHYKNKIKETNTKSDSLYWYNYKNYVDEKEVINALPNKLKYLTNKKEVFKTIFNDFELDKNSVYFGLSHFFIHIIREKSIPKVLNDKISFIKYQLFLFNRSSNNIKKLFTDETIDMIASFFKGNSYYKDSGAQYYIEGLLITQGSLKFKEDSEEVLREYYNSLNKEYGWYDAKTLAMDKKLFDKKVIRYFRNAHFSNYDKGYRKNSEGELTDEAVEEFTKLSYSFWARRYHEGNQEIVFEILSKIHYKITGNDVLWGDE